METVVEIGRELMEPVVEVVVVVVVVVVLVVALIEEEVMRFVVQGVSEEAEVGDSGGRCVDEARLTAVVEAGRTIVADGTAEVVVVVVEVEVVSWLDNEVGGD